MPNTRNNFPIFSMLRYHKVVILKLRRFTRWYERMSLPWKEIMLLVFGSLPCVFLPTAFLFLMGRGDLWSRALLFHFLVFVLIYSTLHFLVNSRMLSFLRGPFIFLAGCYYLILSFLLGYWIVMNNVFDVLFLKEFGVDFFNAYRVLGMKRFVVSLAILGILLFLFILFWSSVARKRNVVSSNILVVINVCVIAILSILHWSAVYSSYVRVPNGDESTLIAVPKMGVDDSFAGEESVFIVQLESTNSMAMMGQLEWEGKRYSETYLPEMEAIAKDGIFLPYFFNNQQMTIRAMESILCGIPASTGKALADTPDQLPAPCIPSILKKAGYETYFYSGLPDAQFANEEPFVRAMGFDAVHFGDIAKPGDTKWQWGYDDCQWYQRVFEDLRQHSEKSRKKFVYIQVSASHCYFDPKAGYETVHRFPATANKFEKYLDSMLEQDQCLSVLYDRYSQYSPAHSHLFILGDHPWGLEYGYAHYQGQMENFLVPFVYVPPAARKDEFVQGRTDERHFSQSDLLPTILELLSGRSYQNSFTFALMKSSAAAVSPLYEQCQILHSLYDGATTAVVIGDEKYTYAHATKEVRQANILKDSHERSWTPIASNESFADFVKQYFCKRFNVIPSGG